METKNFHFETQVIHASDQEDTTAGSVTSPIFLSTTFERDEEGRIGPKGFNYTRLANPNRTAVERKLMVLERGEEAFAFASGMAAVTALFQTLLAPGAHVIISDDCYHGVTHLLRHLFSGWGVTHSEVDMTQPSQVAKAIRRETRLILIETPSNPQLKITDIATVVALARKNEVLTVADNTWATPCVTQPLSMGVDFVIHSTTKYLGGHSDILGGAVVARAKSEATTKLREWQTIGGMVPSPFDCWLLARSIGTLSVRFREQSASAARIAEFLQSHPKIEKVYYPGLPTHFNHEVARVQMKNNFGAMLSILVKGTATEAMKLAGSLQIFRHATSLGGIESLIEHRLSAEGTNAKSPANLLRISIGLENVNDLLEDLNEGLMKI